MIALPTHDPHPVSDLAFGELDAENRAVCKAIRTWDLRGRVIDKPGCGAILSLCSHGIRGHCGAIERPASTETRKAA